MALLAISAFIASAASTLSLQVDLLGDCGKSDGEFIEYMLVWSAKFDEVPETLPIKQFFWDRPAVLEDEALVEATLSSLSSAHHRASFLAASTQHSRDWLFAVPIASCGLKLDDEALRVAVCLRLQLGSV